MSDLQELSIDLHQGSYQELMYIKFSSLLDELRELQLNARIRRPRRPRLTEVKLAEPGS